MAKAPQYLVFDEWWGPKLSDHMPAVIGREAAKGRLRAYTPDGADGKAWLVDDFVYAAAEKSSPKGRAKGRPAERRAPPNAPDGEELLVPASTPPLPEAGGDRAIHDTDQYRGSPGAERRWYDDALLLPTRGGAHQPQP